MLSYFCGVHTVTSALVFWENGIFKRNLLLGILTAMTNESYSAAWINQARDVLFSCKFQYENEGCFVQM